MMCFYIQYLWRENIQGSQPRAQCMLHDKTVRKDGEDEDDDDDDERIRDTFLCMHKPKKADRAAETRLTHQGLV